MKKKQILAILMTLTMTLSPQAIFAAAEEPVIEVSMGSSCGKVMLSRTSFRRGR